MNILNNILRFKKTSFGVIMSVLAIVVIIVITLGTNSKEVQQYQFPLKSEDIEKVLAEQEIDMNIIENNAVDGTRNIATLRNENNITFGIDSQVRNNYKVLSLSWVFPKILSSDEVNDFFHNELTNQFELAGIFYGNKKGLDKALNEILDYYLDENNDNGVYWSKRVGNDHLRVNISNQTISLQIMSDESYEDYLRAVDEGWRNSAETEKIKISNSTVAEMVDEAKDDLSSENEMDIFSKHFVIKGQLKNIKENKKVPEALININSNYLMLNKDKYLSAKLVDSTGSVDVFLQMTSLNSNQLGMERNHNIVLLFNNNEPVYVVRFSTLDSK